MKVAISIPDSLFMEAERAAARLAVTRSGLYQRALERFLSESQAADTTRRMNKALEREAESDGGLDPTLAMAQFQSLAAAIGDDEW
jgi:hypothetical protein